MPDWLPAGLDDFLWTYQNLVHALGINGMLALSMYVVLAVGQLSLGQAAFMGLGAYSSALMTLQLKLPFPLVLPLSVVVPVLFALAIAALMLRERIGPWRWSAVALMFAGVVLIRLSG